jgi:NhaP-type Na+/H+ or K+/H+ antiporter
MAFSVALIIILGLCGDYIFKRLKMPGLVGMLMVGIVAGPYILGLISPEMMGVSRDFRQIALIVILLRAGFELHRDKLNQVGRPALIMSFLPAVFEIGGVLLVAPPLLGLSIIEALILGSILAAVSPAVVVPLMIDFMDRGRGIKKGLPTLILGASSIDDVFVIVLFTVFLGMYSGGDASIFSALAQIPISIVLGILSGLVPGYLLYRLFSRFDWRPPRRTMVVLGVAILLIKLEELSQPWISVAGLLGVMAIGFIILEKSEAIAHIISRKLKRLWVFAELLLFVLVGAQVNIHVAWKAGLAGAVIIGIGLVFRSFGTWLSLMGTNLNRKEKFFCVVAYLPKATVQAAIGAIPMAAGIPAGEVILAIAVLSILLTAPTGAVGIKILGEKILDREEKSFRRFRGIREKQGLPRVGERIRLKEDNTVWKVIGENELWDESGTIPIPIIQLRLWKEENAPEQGKGDTVIESFTPMNPSFEDRWEILYDW